MKVLLKNSDFRYKGKLIKEGHTFDADQKTIDQFPDLLHPVTTETKKKTKSDNNSSKRK